MVSSLTHRLVERHVEEDAINEIILRNVGHAGRQHRVHEVRVDHLLGHCADARLVTALGSDPRGVFCVRIE